MHEQRLPHLRMIGHPVEVFEFYRRLAVQRTMRAHEIVECHEECGEVNRTVERFESGARAGVELVSTVETFDQLFERTVCLAFGIEIFQSDDRFQHDFAPVFGHLIIGVGGGVVGWIAVADGREGFVFMTTEVALGHVGVILTLEVSRVARNSSDWYRILDLCAVSDTLIGDEDGLYHPGLFNDRLLLGLKGTMAEAELHVLRARLDGGIRNKAARGELRRGLPVGLVWGNADGEVLKHPDEAVAGAIGTVFTKFAEMGSARRGCFFSFGENHFPFAAQRL